MYEATLVADDFSRGPVPGWRLQRLDLSEQFGKSIFEGKGKCIACHDGAETTGASVNNVVNAQELLERMIMGNDGIAVYDNGFYNTANTPCAGLQVDDTQGPVTTSASGLRLGRSTCLCRTRVLPTPREHRSGASDRGSARREPFVGRSATA